MNILSKILLESFFITVRTRNRRFNRTPKTKKKRNFCIVANGCHTIRKNFFFLVIFGSFNQRAHRPAPFIHFGCTSTTNACLASRRLIGRSPYNVDCAQIQINDQLANKFILVFLFIIFLWSFHYPSQCVCVCVGYTSIRASGISTKRRKKLYFFFQLFFLSLFRFGVVRLSYDLRK